MVMNEFQKQVNEMLRKELGFEHPVFGGLRVIMKDDEAWFDYSQVAKTLGLHKSIWYYGDGHKKIKDKYHTPKPPYGGVGSVKTLRYNMLIDGVSTIEDYVRTGNKSDGSDAMQKVVKYIIDEVNLYRIIFASQKPNALDFQEWVFGKVLPQIRKTGKYVEGKQKDGCFSIQEFADDFCNHHPLKLGQNKVFTILRNNGVLTRDNLPMRKYIDNGWMSTAMTVSANGRKSYRSLITPKGLKGILGIVKEHHLDKPQPEYDPNQLRIDGTTDRDFYENIFQSE